MDAKTPPTRGMASRTKVVLTPLVLSVIESLFENNADLKQRQPTLHEFKRHVDDIMHDADVIQNIKAVENEFTTEPRSITGLRNAVRPAITILLTCGFVVLILIGAFKTLTEGELQQWHAVLTVFLAVYGPIIGFWFGEHTALKGKLGRRH